MSNLKRVVCLFVLFALIFNGFAFAIDFGSIANSVGSDMESKANLLSMANLSLSVILQCVVWFAVLTFYKEKLFWLALGTGILFIFYYNGVIVF